MDIEYSVATYDGNIGDIIRQARIAWGYTLKQVADLSGLSVSYISDIEHGRADPSLKSLQSLTVALGLHFNLTPGLVIYGHEWELILAYREDGHAGVLRFIAEHMQHVPIR